jgi:hypothetical protein
MVAGGWEVDICVVSLGGARHAQERKRAPVASRSAAQRGTIPSAHGDARAPARAIQELARSSGGPSEWWRLAIWPPALGERAAVRALLRFGRRCFLVAVTDPVLARVRRPFPVEPIRTLDAVHLATADLLGDPPALLSS